MNTSILSVLIGTEVKNPTDVIHKGFTGNNSENAGCWIKAQNVNSICSGVVLAVEKDINSPTWCVTVEVDSQQWVRYCYLSGVKILVGATLSKGTSIGYAYKNLIRFEYCTSSKSQFPVRTTTKQLYKQDPTPVLFGQIKLSEVI